MNSMCLEHKVVAGRGVQVAQVGNQAGQCHLDGSYWLCYRSLNSHRLGRGSDGRLTGEEIAHIRAGEADGRRKAMMHDNLKYFR